MTLLSSILLTATVLLIGCVPESEKAPGLSKGELTPVASENDAIPVRTFRTTNLTQSKHADGYASFSPDGKRLAFSSVRDGNRDLYLMTLASGGLERLTEHPADDGGPPAWSKDGATLYFRLWIQPVDV